MKETILSGAEKSFVLKAISEKKRLDGRKLDECRNMQIFFGNDWGCCMVCLGQTKVLAQVSCEVLAPKATRPNEGLLFLNVELSPMGAPHFDTGRQSELSVQLNRLLEKCIKDSRCVDLESLCIVAEEKVWALRVDIHVLNHEGSLVDAASTAALTALCHFRRPDVTTTGEQIVVHDLSERDPIPISLHHHPVCITYAMFNKGEHVVIDPTVIEERVSDSQVVFGVNAYRELCGLHLGGSALSSPDIVLLCSYKAANRAAEVVQLMKTALEEDAAARAEGKPLGFAEFAREGKILALSCKTLNLQLNTHGLRNKARKLVARRESEEVDSDEEEPEVVTPSKGSAELVPKKERKKRNVEPEEVDSDEVSPVKGSADLVPKREGIKCNGDVVRVPKSVKEEEEDSMDDESDIEVVKEVSYEERLKVIDSIELSGDSEEEDTLELRAEDLQEKKKSKQRGWYPMQQW